MSLCIAVGSAGGVFTYKGTWSTKAKVDAFGGFTAVSCPSASFCMAVDNANKSFTYNGSSWSLSAVLTASQGLQSGGEGFVSVSCPSASFCTAADGAADALAWRS